MSNFQIKDEALDPETHVIELAGELDLSTAQELKHVLAEVLDAGTTRLVIDLTAATFIDSTTLAALTGAHRRLRAGGGAAAIASTNDNIARVLQITALDQVFPICSSREAALQELSGPQAG